MHPTGISASDSGRKARNSHVFQEFLEEKEARPISWTRILGAPTPGTTFDELKNPSRGTNRTRRFTT